MSADAAARRPDAEIADLSARLPEVRSAAAAAWAPPAVKLAPANAL